MPFGAVPRSREDLSEGSMAELYPEREPVDAAELTPGDQHPVGRNRYACPLVVPGVRLASSVVVVVEEVWQRGCAFFVGHEDLSVVPFAGEGSVVALGLSVLPWAVQLDQLVLGVQSVKDRSMSRERA